MADRAFLASHARVLGIAPQPGVRLPGIAASLGITDLAEAGHMVKLEDGRRNRYQSPGTPAPTRTHPAGTHLRRSPGPPGRNWRRAVPDAERASEATSKRGRSLLSRYGIIFP